ncbi:2-phosphosulfolactate phosphatase [Nocardioides speluncae]|uniref:2-phosphosulfolactate phosphatase n=1 Tax=Nocardioides speluncae TaxID=2670337 RepID=UPI000D699030|nr:2-phosphosulfolactate phosphatase [Nocardioides speluncae]
MSFDPAHTQREYAVRFDWGPTGAAATAADIAVVVDVLSFTTTLSVAVERGIEVLPFRWRDDRAAAYAEEQGATLAVGRFEARSTTAGAEVSLSPASVAAAEGLKRLVLPSPNGSAISFGLADSGAIVLGASLRNRRAVAAYVATLAAESVTVIAAGERWPDGSLRPCVEDLWGAGAVLSALADLGVTGLSPEARVAEASYRAVESRLAEDLGACAGARELAEAGFADDVEVAAQLDVSHAVPLLVDGVYVAQPG